MRPVNYIIITVLTSILLCTSIVNAAPTKAQIKGNSIAVRDRPWVTNSALVTRLKDGDAVFLTARTRMKFRFLKTENYWYRLASKDPFSERWVYGDYLQENKTLPDKVPFLPFELPLGSKLRFKQDFFQEGSQTNYTITEAEAAVIDPDIKRDLVKSRNINLYLPWANAVIEYLHTQGSEDNGVVSWFDTAPGGWKSIEGFLFDRAGWLIPKGKKYGLAMFRGFIISSDQAHQGTHVVAILKTDLKGQPIDILKVIGGIESNDSYKRIIVPYNICNVDRDPQPEFIIKEFSQDGMSFLILNSEGDESYLRTGVIDGAGLENK